VTFHFSQTFCILRPMCSSSISRLHVPASPNRCFPAFIFPHKRADVQTLCLYITHTTCRTLASTLALGPILVLISRWAQTRIPSSPTYCTYRTFLAVWGDKVRLSKALTNGKVIVASVGLCSLGAPYKPRIREVTRNFMQISELECGVIFIFLSTPTQ
jgi:hypothetical protein